MTKKVVDVATQSVTFTFDDGTTEVVELAKLSPDMVVRAALHGISQKVGDAYANAAKAESPLAFAKEAVTETRAQIYANDWNATRTGTSGPRTSILAQALARITGKTEAEAVAFVDSLDEDQTKAWKAKGKVKLMMATITAERAAAKAAALATASTDEEVAFN
jgi:hypothetical protein